ncbi:MAG TPA: hypothetical protein VHM91_20895 [Verrucomicrobiales bacterium]|nr:hypothetical protein [Verrucomicrobiales bacterium]
MKRLAALSLLGLNSSVLAQGPYPPGPSQPGTDAIPGASALFKGWAHGVVSFQPGPRRAGTNSLPANYGSAASALGSPDAAGSQYEMPVAEGPVLSLGDGGRVTLSFTHPIADGEGPDFAVFENGFTTTGYAIFAELAFVEVSSNGVDFVRFPAVSLTPTTTQTGPFATLDPRDLHNLAGKYPAGYGTPFDLAELAGNPLLNINRITQVRLVDVVGDVTTGFGSRDSEGRWINDPFPTDFQTSGFDLDAVGVIHEAQDPWQDWIAASFDSTTQNDPAITGPDADPDGDGKTNLVEYATGFPPANPDTVPALAVSSEGANVTLRFFRDTGRADCSLTLQESPDGQTWAPLASSISGQATTAANGATVGESGSPQATVTVTVPRTEARRLYRLKVSRDG